MTGRAGWLVWIVFRELTAGHFRIAEKFQIASADERERLSRRTTSVHHRHARAGPASLRTAHERSPNDTNQAEKFGLRETSRNALASWSTVNPCFTDIDQLFLLANEQPSAW
jgi:hypothetical protein